MRLDQQVHMERRRRIHTARHYLYELWDDERNECLYVGLSARLPQRLEQHSRKAWYPRVTRVVADVVEGTRHDGLRAERERIDQLQPLFNWYGTEQASAHRDGRRFTATRAEVLGPNT